MRIASLLLVPPLLAVVGFFAGGLFARFVLVGERNGFDGVATVFWACLVGTALGLALAYVLLRR